jgi:hypothetical protein
MIKSLILISLFFIQFGVFAKDLEKFGPISPISIEYKNRIVNAIYLAENSKKYPYGIKSIPIKGDTQQEREAYARKICFNTVSNNYLRWQKAGKTNDFITFLGGRYAPITDKEDKTHLNQFWIKNVKFYLEKDKKI